MLSILAIKETYGHACWAISFMRAIQIEDNMPPNVEVVTIVDGCDWNLGYPYFREEMAMLRSWVTETAPIRTPKLVEI